MATTRLQLGTYHERSKLLELRFIRLGIRVPRAVKRIHKPDRPALVGLLVTATLLSVLCGAVTVSLIGSASAGSRFAMVYTGLVPLVSLVLFWLMARFTLGSQQRIADHAITTMRDTQIQVREELHDNLTPGYLALTHKDEVVRNVTDLIQRARCDKSPLFITGAPGVNQQIDEGVSADLSRALEEQREAMLLAMADQLKITRYVRLMTPEEFWQLSDTDRRMYALWIENEIQCLSQNNCYHLIQTPVAPAWSSVESLITDRCVMVKIIGRGESATRIRGEQVVGPELDSRIHQFDYASVTPRPCTADNLGNYLAEITSRPLEFRSVETRSELLDAAAELIERAIDMENARVVYHGAANLFNGDQSQSEASRYDAVVQSLMNKRFPVRRYVSLMQTDDYEARPPAVRIAYESWVQKEQQLLQINPEYELYHCLRAAPFGSVSNKIITQIGYLEIAGNGDYGRVVIGDNVTRDHRDFFFDEGKAAPERQDVAALTRHLRMLREVSQN